MRQTLTLLFTLLFCTCVPAQKLLKTTQDGQRYEQSLLYLHTDQTLYPPGGAIHFRAYLRNGLRKLDNVQTDVVTVELVDGGGTIRQTVHIGWADRGFYGVINPPDGLPGGRYTLRAYTNWLGNFTKDLQFSKHIYYQSLQQDRLLLSLEPNRQAFAPGEALSFDLYVRGKTGFPLPLQEVTLNLRVGGQSVLSEDVLTDVGGKAHIELPLPADLTTRDVTLTASTLHDGTAGVATRPVPILLPDVQLSFFPEGGHRATGLQRIAFQATNSFGEPVDVVGSIDGPNGAVTDLISRHNGYGSFVLPAGAPEELVARLTGIPDTTFALPRPRAGAVAAHLQVGGRSLSINTPGQEVYELRLATIDSTFLQHKLDGAASNLDLSNYPAGVYEATLLDQAGYARWQRLFFLRPKQTGVIDDVRYELKEDWWDELNFTLKDTGGRPLSGDFSLTVVNDGLHTKLNDKQGHIVASLLLESQVRGEIFEPNDYFDPQQPAAMAALDDVLLCHGWRAADWILPTAPTFAHIQRGIAGRPAVRRGEVVRYPKRPIKIAGMVRRANSDGWYVQRTARQPGFSAPYWNQGIYHDFDYYQGIGYGYSHPQTLPFGTLYQPALVTGLQAKSVDATEQENIRLAAPEDMGQTVPVEADLQGRSAGLEISGQLEEVVVVGYGTLQKNDLTGCVVAVHSVGYRGGTELTTQEYYSSPDRPHNYFEYQREEPLSVQPSWSYYPVTQRHSHRRYRPRNAQAPDHLLWMADLQLDGGRAQVPYQDVSRTATYRLIVEGITDDGTPIHAERNFSRTGSFDFEVNWPYTAVVGDSILLTAVLRNNTQEPIALQGRLQARAYDHLNPDLGKLTLQPKEIRTVTKLLLPRKAGAGGLIWSFEARELMEHYEESAEITVRPRLFTHELTIGGRGRAGQTLNFNIDTLEAGAGANLVFYGDPVARLQQELTRMLREPYGCFEQTLSSTLPNVYLARLLQSRQDIDQDLLKRAVSNSRAGYKRLQRYVGRQGGFSLYGYGYGNVGLTALALHGYADMRGVVPGMDRAHAAATVAWLRKKNQYFVPNVTQAYILWAMLRHGADGLDPLIQQHVAHSAAHPKDMLHRLLVSQLLAAGGDKEGARSQVQSLVDYVRRRSIPRESGRLSFSHWNYGNNYQVEVLSYFVEAYHDLVGTDAVLLDAVNWLEELMSGGRYLTTRARAGYSRAVITVASDLPSLQAGNIAVSLNGQAAVTGNYLPGKGLTLSLPEKALRVGHNVVDIDFEIDGGYPYLSLNAYYERSVPQQGPAPPLRLHTTASPAGPVAVNDLVRWEVTIQNELDTAVYAPMVQLGLPGNAEIILKDLDPLVERGVIGRYERDGAYLNLYFTEFAAGEKRVIPLDFKAVAAGTFSAPPSVVYPYYAPADRYWSRTPVFTTYTD